jgi:hypothetical protein
MCKQKDQATSIIPCLPQYPCLPQSVSQYRKIIVCGIQLPLNFSETGNCSLWTVNGTVQLMVADLSNADTRRGRRKRTVFPADYLMTLSIIALYSIG